MSTASFPFTVPRPVAKKVSRLRWLIRLYVWLDGIAALIIVLGVAFWAGLAVDWLLEPRPAARAVMWFAVGLAFTVVAFRVLLVRIAAPLSSESLALLVERRHPALREGLVTTMQAAGRPFQTGPGRELIDATARQTAQAMSDVDLRRVLKWRPLVWRVGIAALAVASIAQFALSAPDAYAFWLSRMQFNPQQWPRRVELAAAGFPDEDGVRVEYVARDDEYELTVFASIIEEHQAPEVVEVRWRRPADGGRGGGAMRQIGEALPGRDEAQEYRFTFKVAGDMEFDVIGGDDRIEGLLLRAVERPAITELTLDCRYPEYTQLAERTVAGSSRVELPEGTRATMHVRANKALAQVVVRDDDARSPLAATIDSSDPRVFAVPLEEVCTDRRLAISMVDAQGVENREPYRLAVSARMDEPPDVSMRLRGIGAAVTPTAVIPFDGRLNDDFALERAWYEYRVNESKTSRRPLQSNALGLRELRVLESFDLSTVDPQTSRPLLELQPGDRLSLSVQCSDAYNLADQPHVSGSQTFLLDVVTPSELRAILEKRELGLRQRFEAIYEKMVGTRELLDRIDPADAAASESDASPADRQSRQRDLARIAGIRQNATQLAFESSGVAGGFDDIVAEMVNNRVDTEELKRRLSGGIAEPLRKVGGDLLPRWEETLNGLHAAFDREDPSRAVLLARSQTEADEVLEHMKAILDQMLELESYNEIVELLRTIVEQQKELEEATKRQQRANLRSLLED